MSNKIGLIEIKRNQIGLGLLIECDGYISPSIGNNKQLFESLKEGFENTNEWKVPNPFIVSAVFQKYGIKNANGRIYPEQVLKRQVEAYMIKIKEHRAYGQLNHPECLLSDVNVLSETGWKNIADLKLNETILTLNENGVIENNSINKLIKQSYKGKLIRLKGRLCDIKVTPNHKFPIYDRDKTFKGFYTAQDILDKNVPDQNHSYIPKRGVWNGKNDEYFTINGLTDKEILETYKSIENYSFLKEDLIIPMEEWMKFMGIYLSEGDCSQNSTRKTSKNIKYTVQITQKKENICEEIRNLLNIFPCVFNEYGKDIKRFKSTDLRLIKYLKQFGNCYSKYVPLEIKTQSKEMLRVFYDWFVMGDGRKRGTGNYQNTDDVFSTSKQMIMDLNEIQLKIGYCGSYHEENRKKDRFIGDRLIKAENSSNMYFSLRSMTNGLFLREGSLSVTEEDYEGEVYCLEIDNHTFYTMSSGKCLWSGNSSTVDGKEISHNIIELHWEGRTLVGKMELHLSPGYVKHGIVSTNGDMVANLLLSGYKIGVSSRGVGSVDQKFGEYVVGDDFELICWDVVTDPSTPNAWIASDSEQLRPYMENKEENSNTLLEKINKVNLILN